jgi:hypothetical protein
MSTELFEKTNWNWQFSQFQRQVGEWLEYQLSRFYSALPELYPQWSIASWFSDLLKVLFWAVLGLFLAWLGWRLWREFNPYLYTWLARVRNSSSSRANNTEKQVSVAGILAHSQELYRLGNYRDACRYIYLAMLQHLHEKAILPHKLSRTDGEYLQLLQISVTPIQPYETLITTHEQLSFSDAEVTRENYEQCYQAYWEIANG